jgi:hypothetical protein
MPKCINALKHREDITLQERRRRIEVLTEQVRVEQVRVEQVRVEQVRRDAEQKARELRLKQAAVQMGMLWLRPA